MCQQPAITEKLTAGRAHPPAADASAEDTSPAERDPFLDHYFRRIDPRVAASFSPEQRDAIKAMFGARGVARHTVEIRRSLPIGRGRYYLVLLLGRERRTVGRLYSEGSMSTAFNLLGYRSEEHTSELQSLMRISYAVFCLKKKKNTNRK